jgi:hypothetical protein
MLTVNEFRDNLLKMKGSTIVTLHTDTKPAMIVTGNPYVAARKRSTVNGVINWIYETVVNRQRIKEELEPNFKAFPRKWGQRIKGTPLVEHKGNFYLEMKVEKSHAHYYIGTEPLESNLVIPFLRPLGKSRQGVEKEIILRDYALESIKGITYAKTYTEIS